MEEKDKLTPKFAAKPGGGIESSGAGKLTGNDYVVLGIGAVSLIAGFLAAIFWEDYLPILIAFSFSLGASAVVYGFLGGIQALYEHGGIRLGGAAAMLLIFTLAINHELVLQSKIDPSPETILALNSHSATPVAVTVHGVKKIELPQDDVLKDHQWGAEWQQTGLRLFSSSQNSFSFGYIPSSEIQSLKLYNTVIPGQFRVTNGTPAGSRNNDLYPYAFMLDTGTYYGDGNRQYAIKEKGSDKQVIDGVLKNKEAVVFRYKGKSYLLMVTEESKIDNVYTARFGFVELKPSLDLQQS